MRGDKGVTAEAVKCYLCPKGASQEETRDNMGSIEVRCPECGLYRITDIAMQFYILAGDPDDRFEDLLDGEDKRKLAGYVRAKHERDKDAPVLLDARTIEEVTGKLSPYATSV